jgi:hypothetical protein
MPFSLQAGVITHLLRASVFDHIRFGDRHGQTGHPQQI